MGRMKDHISYRQRSVEDDRGKELSLLSILSTADNPHLPPPLIERKEDILHLTNHIFENLDAVAADFVVNDLFATCMDMDKIHYKL